MTIKLTKEWKELGEEIAVCLRREMPKWRFSVTHIENLPGVEPHVSIEIERQTETGRVYTLVLRRRMHLP